MYILSLLHSPVEFTSMVKIRVGEDLQKHIRFPPL